MVLTNPLNLTIVNSKTKETFIFRNIELHQVIISLYNWRMQGYIGDKDAKAIIRTLDSFAVKTLNVEAMEEIDKGLFEVDKIMKENMKNGTIL